MKNIILLSLALPLTVYAAKPDTKTVVDLITRNDRAWGQAYVDKDIAKLEELMADELVSTDAEGNLYLKGKAQNIDAIKTGKVVYESLKIEETHVVVHGDTAISVGKFNVKGKAEGKPFAGRFAYTDTWIQKNGKWRAIMEHVTPIKSP